MSPISKRNETPVLILSLLITASLLGAAFSQAKEAGIEAMKAQQYRQAVTLFESALQKTRNAPETLIYLNNARIGNDKAYTVAVAVPIGSDSDGASEILRGVAQDFPAFKPIEQSLKQGVKVLMLAANTGTLDKALQVVDVAQQRVNLLGGNDVYSPKTL